MLAAAATAEPSIVESASRTSGLRQLRLLLLNAFSTLLDKL